MEHVTEEDVTGDVGGGLDGINCVVVVIVVSQHFCFCFRMEDGSSRSWHDGMMSAAEDKESGDGGLVVVQLSSLFVLSASP
jgi:hypothetical protein